MYIQMSIQTYFVVYTQHLGIRRSQRDIELAQKKLVLNQQRCRKIGNIRNSHSTRLSFLSGYRAVTQVGGQSLIG